MPLTSWVKTSSGWALAQGTTKGLTSQPGSWVSTPKSEIPVCAHGESVLSEEVAESCVPGIGRSVSCRSATPGSSVIQLDRSTTPELTTAGTSSLKMVARPHARSAPVTTVWDWNGIVAKMPRSNCSVVSTRSSASTATATSAVVCPGTKVSVPCAGR